ncbi:OmpP1/FadL family transporter [Amaricoccus sp.]|uniref:OmpP1/FadL family transporter n=1 Tax=Amaricoccus sp. TaxID=1872485 RepID=UPI001B4FA172|nr:outer membrane protein transport protein [Amaricoccus sp.]MBP7001290.1 outer membrane protein transport protein [Amaricoccus sp.]
MSAPVLRHGAVLLACGCALPATAFAAALERAVPATVRILYEDGTYGEIGAVYTHPDLEGKNGVLPPSLGGRPLSGNTGNLLRSDWKFSGALKGDINEQLSWIVLIDQPYVANTYYSRGSFPTTFNYGGTDADLDTWQISTGLAFDATDRIKIYGGVRAQRLEANAAIPFLSGYSIDADAEWGWGGFVGAAYARPEIGLRVALTYASKISYDLSTTERSDLFGRERDTTSVDTPQAVTLEAQTGVNEKTLVFGSIRWVDWSEFAIAPQMYGDITALALQERRALVDYEKDWWTYNIGVARQLTDDLAGTFSFTYEPQVDEVMTTLGPVDGRTTFGAGLSYDVGKVNIAGGVSYGWLGDATNLLDTKFRDGTILALGLRVGYSF